MVWAVPRSLATTEGIIVYFLFLQVLRCFSSLRSPSALSGMPSLQDGGLSHSEIRASQVICTYTRLFAAYHVLLRLQEPRHPPYALSFCFYVTHTPRYIRTKWHIYFRLYSVPPPKGGDTFFIAFACPKCHRSLIALPAHATNKQRQGKDYCGE